MGLPKIDMPIFEMTLPSSKEVVKYRPFTVKEEKILLMARETRDMDQILLSVKQVINNCLIDKKIEDLAMIDLEYALLSIRAQSVDNSITFTINDPDTKEPVELSLDITDIQLSEDPTHSNKIKVNDDYVLIMQYPTIDEVVVLMRGAEEKKISAASFSVIYRCMDQLVGADEVFKFSEFSKKEITDFVESLDPKVIKKIEQFFMTMPKLRHELKYTNSEGTEKTFVIQGIESFFM